MFDRADFTFDTGPFRSRVKTQPHEGMTYRELTQPNEDAILAENAEKRKAEQKPLEWGRQIASIPALVYSNWLRDNPDLRSGDRQARQRCILRLLREHPEYTVVERVKL